MIVIDYRKLDNIYINTTHVTVTDIADRLDFPVIGPDKKLPHHSKQSIRKCRWLIMVFVFLIEHFVLLVYSTLDNATPARL